MYIVDWAERKGGFALRGRLNVLKTDNKSGPNANFIMSIYRRVA